MANITKKRLRDSPFKTATEEDRFVKKIQSNELEKLIRSQTRQNFISSNTDILKPFYKGQKVEFIVNKFKNSLHTYLDKDGTIIHSVDSSLNNKESGELVKSLLEAIGGVFTRSYLQSLGLINDSSPKGE